MLVCPHGIKEFDVGKVKAEADKRFFLLMGKRTDSRMLDLIPDAENVIVLDGVCSACKGTGSFSSADGKRVLCRGCRIMERNRIRILDEKIHEGLVDKMGKEYY